MMEGETRLKQRNHLAPVRNVETAEPLPKEMNEHKRPRIREEPTMRRHSRRSGLAAVSRTVPITTQILVLRDNLRNALRVSVRHSDSLALFSIEHRRMARRRDPLIA